MAKQKGCTMSALAVAWLLEKGTCPVMGLNSLDRIQTVSEAFTVRLTRHDLEYLEAPYRPLQVQAM